MEGPSEQEPVLVTAQLASLGLAVEVSALCVTQILIVYIGRANSLNVLISTPEMTVKCSHNIPRT